MHLDYLDLYAKHNQQQRQSYRLDAIGEIDECGRDHKVPYEGTSLEDLYSCGLPPSSSRTADMVTSMIMVKIDRKLKFIELANQEMALAPIMSCCTTNNMGESPPWWSRRDHQ